MELFISFVFLVILFMFIFPDLVSQFGVRISGCSANKKTESEAEAGYLEENISGYIHRFLPKEAVDSLTHRIHEVELTGEARLGLLMNIAFEAFCENCIRGHAKVLIRKRYSSIYRDDYGRVIYDRWIGEIAYFVEAILVPFISNEDERYPDLLVCRGVDYCLYVEHYDRQACFGYYREKIEIILDLLDCKGVEDDSLSLPESGHDYERYVAAIFESHGHSARVTKGSGDHGADVVVDLGGGEIVVQCKHYNSPVGNKAVQEVYSAKDFYGAGHAWVVASSSFTPAAKVAAERLGVVLLHHEELPEMLEAIDAGDV